MPATVLLVDDSATIRNLIKVYLMGMDLIFIESECGASALDRLSEKPVDFVIADINMPGMDGLSFVRKLRTSADRALRLVPIILLTSDKTKQLRARGLAAGANEFVLKPVTSSTLRESVTKLLKGAIL